MQKHNASVAAYDCRGIKEMSLSVSWNQLVCEPIISIARCVCIKRTMPLQCPSVRLSVVTRRYCVQTAICIIKFFHHRVSAPLKFFPYQTLWQYSAGNPITARRMQVGYEKSLFSTSIWLYLENDKRYGHSYYGTPIETHMWFIEWCHFICTISLNDPLTQISRSRHYLTLNYPETVRDSNNGILTGTTSVISNDLEWPCMT